MEPNIWLVILALALALPFVDGCSGSKDNPEAGGQPPSTAQANALTSGPSQSAVLLSDTAYRYGSLTPDQPQDPCTVANDYGAAVSRNDLPASVAAYCDILASQNVPVRDCARAQDIAVHVARKVGNLSQECAGQPVSGRPEDPIYLARSIVRESQFYRRELGLPSPAEMREARR